MTFVRAAPSCRRLLFLVAIAAAAAPVHLAGQGMGRLPATETTDLGDGLYAFRSGPYRNIFIVTDEGVIATDPINAEVATQYRAAIRVVTAQPVKYVAYSHSHWDHAAGGRIFKDEGAVFVAQELCAENLRTSPNPAVVMPDVTFTDHYSIELGGRSLELHHFGPIHDTCMSVMIAKPANILFSVDIVSPPTGWYLPFDTTGPDFHPYNVVGYLEGVEKLVAAQGVTEMVGGHLVIGPDATGKRIVHPPVGPATAVTERRLFWQMVLDAVRAELDAGASPIVVHNKVDLEPFRDMNGFTERKMKALLQRIASYYTTGR